MIRVSIRYWIGTLHERKQYLTGNQSPFMNKTLSKEIMTRTTLRIISFKIEQKKIEKNTPSKETIFNLPKVWTYLSC